MSCGSIAWVGHSNLCRRSTDRGQNKTNQSQLCRGNAISKTWVRAPLSDRAPVLGSRSKGLDKWVRGHRARFKVARCRVFCHWSRLQSRPDRFKLFALMWWMAPTGGI